MFKSGLYLSKSLSLEDGKQAKMNVKTLHYFPSVLHGKSNSINRDFTQKRRILQALSSPYQTGSVMAAYTNGKLSNGII